MPASHQFLATIPGEYDDLFQACLESVQKARFKPLRIDREFGLITAEAGLSFWSWGEKVEHRLARSGLLSIKSTCTLSTQIVDWGKNLRIHGS